MEEGLGGKKSNYTRTGCFTSKYVIFLFLALITVVLAVACFLPYYVNLNPEKPFPRVWPTTPCNVTHVEIIEKSRVIYTIKYLETSTTITSDCRRHVCLAYYLQNHTYTCAYKADDHSSVYFEHQLETARADLMSSGLEYFGILAGLIWSLAIIIPVIAARNNKKNATYRATAHFFGNDVNKIPSVYCDLVLEDFEDNEVVLWTGKLPKDYIGKIAMVHASAIILAPLGYFIAGMMKAQYNLAMFGLLVPFLLAFYVYVARIPNYNLITNRRIIKCKSMAGITNVTSLPYHSVTRMHIPSSHGFDQLSHVSVASNHVAIIVPVIKDARTIENIMLKYMHRDQVAALLGDRARSLPSVGSACLYQEWTHPSPQLLTELQNPHFPFVDPRGRQVAAPSRPGPQDLNRRFVNLHMINRSTYDAAYPTELLGLISHHEYTSMIAGLNAELKKNPYTVCGSRGLAMLLFAVSVMIVLSKCFIQTSKKNNVYIEQLNSNVLRARRLELMFMVFGHGNQALRSLVIAVDAL